MRRTFIYLSVVVVFGSFCHSQDSQKAAWAQSAVEVDDGLVTLTAKVLLPDGSPAAGTIVESIEEVEDARKFVRASEEGIAQIRDVFGNSARIHASSPDGTLQATFIVTAPNVRSALAEPVLLQLEPAVPHEVTVFSNDHPVEGAEVVAEGLSYRVRGVTDSAGKARLHLPAGQTLRELAAWHPQLGVAGIQDLDEKLPEKACQLFLLARAPHTIRLVDTEGEPVAGIRLTFSVRTEESDWIILRAIEASYVKTDSNGEAVISWAPEKLKYVDFGFIGSSWKKDKTDRDRMAEGLTTIHIREEKPITGRLVMPEGASAEGILITGFGFGPHSHGDIPYARARKDGAFTMRVPSDHGYVLGVSDSKWASSRWGGLIFAENSSKPANIEIEAYRGTPLTVQVTRGPEHEPVENAWVYIKQRGRVEFTDASGEVRSGSAGVGGWARSDTDGKVHAAVGDGTIEVRLSSGDWNEEQSVEVFSDEPIEIAFHRPWLGDRKVVARMTLDGAPYAPSETLVAHAFSERAGGYYDTVHETEIGDDGNVTVSFDAENLSLLVLDQEKQLSGFSKLGAEETTTELIMQPMATYDGWLFDEEGKPLADRTVQVWKNSSKVEVADPQQTDETGLFEFTSVPAEVPLRLVLKNETHLPQYYVRGSNERLFEPGEQRSGDVVLVRLRNDSDRHEKASPDPLTARLTGLCRKASVSRMRTLVILQGEGSADVSNLTSRLLDDEEVQPILSYLPLRLTPAEIDVEADALGKLDLPLPKEGEVVLVVVGDDKQAIDSARIDAEELTAAIVTATEFLTRHVFPTRNALDLFADVKAEASNSGRRIWLIQGGPRCGPCFRLAQWIDEHHSELEKDYVILKLMSAVDEQVSEVMDQIGKEKGGVPWHAILEPDGTVITTSDGPLGNIGMPRSVESIRHFRTMIEDTAQHLTAGQINKLMESLSDRD